MVSLLHPGSSEASEKVLGTVASRTLLSSRCFAATAAAISIPEVPSRLPCSAVSVDL